MKPLSNLSRILFGCTFLFSLLFILGACGDDDGGGNENLLGTLRVNITTSGDETDDDGYTVSLNNGNPQQVGNNGFIAFELLDPGAYTVTIDGIRLTCYPNQGLSQSATVRSGETTTIDFTMECTYKALVFGSNRGDAFDLYRMNLDGSGLVKVIDGGWGPRWSPDGSKISYWGDDNGLYIIDDDGTEKTLVMENAEPGSWSPDGQKLVTVSNMTLYTVNIDGTGMEAIPLQAEFVADPDWGPESDPRIIFEFQPVGEPAGIFAVNHDGTGLTRITEGNDFQPAWSKDGSKILFTRDADGGVAIYTKEMPDGEPVRRTGPGEQEVTARWSPDGSQLTFTTLLPDGFGGFNQEICIGSSTMPCAINLTQNDANDLRSDWKPDI